MLDATSVFCLVAKAPAAMEDHGGGQGAANHGRGKGLEDHGTGQVVRDHGIRQGFEDYGGRRGAEDHGGGQWVGGQSKHWGLSPAAQQEAAGGTIQPEAGAQTNCSL